MKKHIEKIGEEIIPIPRNFCYVCGKKDITFHHLRTADIKSKKKKGKVNGMITLCRECHNIVEDIVNKGKSKKRWFEKGYQNGKEEMMKLFEDKIDKLEKKKIRFVDETCKRLTIEELKLSLNIK